ncbi:hypothetical protein [Pseudomonas sp. SDI]|uniref:hypothetical protein n=1 Tax=Pseudomonas sp. SDI TaxID=2170734 RepID=UPI002113E9C9|nr:hypothetical protein [Pseudomonas sp. SDI]
MDKKNPHAALHAPIRPDRYAEPRKLSGDQLKKPLIRKAFWRLSRIGELRGRYLRQLDTIHGGRRTRSEKFDALARVAEQLLVRMDLATGVLGWLDVEQGRYFLNTQCGVAEDSGISASILNRLMHSLDKAGYVYRRIERVRLDEKDEAGLNLVRTRVLVRFTEDFWADLGLRFEWHRAKKSAIKRRDQELRAVAMARVARQEKASLEELNRQVSRRRWQESEARKVPPVSQAALPSGSGPPPTLKPPERSAAGPEDVTRSMARLLESAKAKKTT